MKYDVVTFFNGLAATILRVGMTGALIEGFQACRQLRAGISTIKSRL
jgi:hypothetical protein